MITEGGKKGRVIYTLKITLNTLILIKLIYYKF